MSILNQPFSCSGHTTPAALPPANLQLHGVPAATTLRPLPPPSSQNTLLFDNPTMKPEFTLFPAPSTPKLVVMVSSAVALERRQIGKIKRKLRRMTGVGDLSVESAVDPTLIAGFVVRYDEGEEGRTKVIDLSVKGQLAELASRMETSDKKSDELEHGWGLMMTN